METARIIALQERVAFAFSFWRSAHLAHNQRMPTFALSSKLVLAGSPPIQPPGRLRTGSEARFERTLLSRRRA